MTDTIAELRALLAETLCNDAGARFIAGQIDAPAYADSADHVQRYWQAIASAALPALLDRVEAGDRERDRLALLARANNDLARRHQVTITQMQSRCARISDQAEFLIDRLSELEWTDDGYREVQRDFFGHVEPAIARLRDALQQKADTP